MKFFVSVTVLIAFILIQGCSTSRRTKYVTGNETAKRSTEELPATGKVSAAAKSIPPRTIDTKNADPVSVVDFAETLIGTKYKYGSTIKENGFDCSGFVTYVFSHFNISVPRVSKDFTNAGTPVPLEKSRKGDLILFTGTDTTGWMVGHMGFITENNNGKVRFIHAASGKSIGVIISELSRYYATRFVKVVRVFDE